MERATGPDAGRVSLNARFDLTYIDQMAAALVQQAKQLGAKKICLAAREQTESGLSSLAIEIEMQP